MDSFCPLHSPADAEQPSQVVFSKRPSQGKSREGLGRGRWAPGARRPERLSRVGLLRGHQPGPPAPGPPGAGAQGDCGAVGARRACAGLLLFRDSSFYRGSTPVGFRKFFTDTRGSLVAHTVENLPAVQVFRYSVLSDSLQPHRLQASLSLTSSWNLLKLMSIESMMPSNRLILCLPFSSCPHSFPASRCFPMSQLFASGGQRIGASASDLPVNIQG